MSPALVRTAAARAREPVAVGLCYFAAAAIALQLTRFGGGVAVVWLAGPLLLAKLATTPRWRWAPILLACLLGGAAASALFGFGRGVAIPLACVSLGEALGAAVLLKRVCRRFGRFQSVVETTRFIAVAGLLAPAVSAVLGAAGAHWAAGVPFWAAWRDWFAGHALGFVAFAPPLLLALRGEVGRWWSTADRRGRWEAAGLLGAVALASVATFGQDRVPIVLVPIVPMVAATLRLGRFGAVLSTLILIAVGLGCSLARLGPVMLLDLGMAARLQLLQLYFATTVLILLPLAAELTARRRLTDRLRAAESLHRLILDRTGDIVLRLGIDGTVRYASPAVARVWGYAPEELVRRPAFDVIEPEDRPALLAARAEALANPDATPVAEYRVRRRDGTLVWAESHMRATVDEAGRVTGSVSIVREVTEKRALVEELARRAATDPLTGLCNRRAFDAALTTRLGGAADVPAGCVAVFDLDHFKSINDQFGHPVGDLVLKRFAAVLAGSVREGDLAARLGGEEFAVLLAGASAEQSERVCERIRQRFEAGEDRTEAGVVRATASAGIAALARGAEPATLVAAADAALYRAKQAGRNRLMWAA